ncbi:MAG: NosD domain-containing protein [Promethearchaeota archaeon]
MSRSIRLSSFYLLLFITFLAIFISKFQIEISFESSSSDNYFMHDPIRETSWVPDQDFIISPKDVSPLLLDGNDAVDSFFINSSGDGLSRETAYVLENNTFDSVFLESCIIIKNSDRFINVTNNTFTHSSVSQGIAAIYLYKSSNIVVENNDFIEDYFALFLYNCSEILINNNEFLIGSLIFSPFYDLTVGISIIESNNITFSRNNINQYYTGLYMKDADNGLILENNILSNHYGIRLLDCSFNTLYYNLFDSNVVQAIDDNASNSWDNGSLGNIWSDYTDRYPNASNNGLVWDTPYAIAGNLSIYDNYPMVADLLPVADFFTNTTIVYLGSSISFMFSGHKGDIPVEFSWNFGDNSTSTLENPIHFYEMPGLYSVSLTVTDANGNSSYIKKDNVIRVIGLPEAPNLSANTTQCRVNETISLLWNATENAVYYKIYKSSRDFQAASDATLITTTQNTTLNLCFNSTGTFYIAIFATNPAGDSEVSNRIQVVVTNDDMDNLTRLFTDFMNFIRQPNFIFSVLGFIALLGIFQLRSTSSKIKRDL